MSQQAAPGAAQRGAVQNAALDASLSLESERGTQAPTSGTMPVGQPTAANPTGSNAAASAGPIGTPESGYGPGGVTNPAYQGSTVPSGATVNPGGSGTLPNGTQVASTVPGVANPTGAPASPTAAAGMSQAQRAALTYGNVGTLNGFRTDGYGGDLKAANTVKNTFAKIASRYQNTPSGLRALMNDPDFKAAFPNARLVEGGAGDKIDFGGVLSDFESGTPVGIVDVGLSFDPTNDTGAGWWWGAGDDGSGGGGGGPAPAPQGGGTPMSIPGASQGGGDYISQLLAYLTRQMAMDQALR